MLSSSKARNPLDLNGADFSALMKDVVRLLAEFLDHLWGLAFGAGNTNSGGANQLFFNAGINKQTGGLHGFFASVTADLTQGNDQ